MCVVIVRLVSRQAGTCEYDAARCGMYGNQEMCDVSGCSRMHDGNIAFDGSNDIDVMIGLSKKHILWT